MEKISLIFLLGLTLAMITANVSNGSFVLAKDESSSSGSDSGGGSSSGGSSDSNSDNGKGSQTNEQQQQQSNIPEAKPSKPTDTSTGMGIVEETGKPIIPADPNKINNPNPTDTPKSTAPIDFNCHFHPDDCKPDIPGQCPGGFSSNDHGNCFPSGPCPPGFGRHDNDESGQCFKTKDFCHFHDCHPHVNTIVKIVHQTKVIHKTQKAGVATVFVPGIGLVEPFNCKLNDNKGKINCEFLIVKVIN